MAIAIFSSAFFRVAGSTLVWPVTLHPSDDRVLIVVAHTRGSPGFSDVHQVVLRPPGGGAVLATLTEIFDADSGGVIHTTLFELREADFPSDGTYDLSIETVAADQVVMETLLVSGVDQSEPALVDGHAQADTAQTITLGSQRPLVSIPRDGSLIVDGTSGENGFAVVATSGLTRDFSFPQVQSPLSAAGAYTFADIADGPADLGWTYGAGMLRLCMAYALYQPVAAVPTLPAQANANILGAVA